jgi:HK97 family phage major capsid protein
MPIAIAIPKIQSRFLELETQDVQVQGDTITLSFASDTPVDRGGYLEILDPAGCDLSRVRAGSCPWLWNHSQDKVLGIVEGAWRSGQKLYAKCRPGRNLITDQYLEDIQAGVIPQTSCRYTIDEYRPSIDSQGREVVTITAWKLLEVSSVSVPADPSTGVGRSQDFSSNQGEKTMPTAIRAERERLKMIDTMTEFWGPRLVGGMTRALEIKEQAIESGLNEQQTRNLFCDEIEAHAKEPESYSRPLPQYEGSRGFTGNSSSSGVLGLSERDISQYSILRVLQAIESGNWSNAGLELECSRALQKKGFDGQNLIPTEALRVFTTSGGAQAQPNLVGTDHMGGSFIDALRSKTVSIAMGATMMQGLQGNVEIPRQSAVSALGWVAQDADLPESNANTDRITLSPRTVGCYAEIGRMIAVQSDPNIEQMILKDFAAQLAIELDRAMLMGTGVANQPTGILNTAGIGSVSLGVNGGPPTWDAVTRLEALVATADADNNTQGYCCHPMVRQKLKNTLKNAIAGSDYLWKDSDNTTGLPQTQGGVMNGYKSLTSTTLPQNLTKGTGTGLGALIFGDFSSVILGSWGALSLEVNPYQNFRSGRISLRVLMFADVAIRYAKAFSAITDMILT